ncbi:MAG: matrixin family metalloprotease [Vampirovibrionales bacterium]|nr:matrixin family metalloprotease [Vampirovibrionales bacterium]
MTGPLLKLNAAQGSANIGGYTTPSSHPSHGLLHWPQFPLTLVVNTLPETLQGLLTIAEVEEALRRWESHLPYALFTVLPPNSSHGQVMVCWDGQPMASHPYEAGHCCRYASSKGIIEKAVITIVPQAVIDERLSSLQRRNRLLNTLAHEMGHALGLEHHIDPKSLMHPQGWRNTHPNNSDLQQWKRLQRLS